MENTGSLLDIIFEKMMFLSWRFYDIDMIVKSQTSNNNENVMHSNDCGMEFDNNLPIRCTLK